MFMYVPYIPWAASNISHWLIILTKEKLVLHCLDAKRDSTKFTKVGWRGHECKTLFRKG
jgi:hypothetical protein